MERKSIDDRKRRKPSGAALIRSDLTTALVRAFFEEWANVGYAAISLERVAARAGAGKAAIYRRWPGKREFASEAIERVAVGLGEFSDHGSLEADITAYLTKTRLALRHPLVRRIVPDLAAERIRSGDLAAVLDRIAAARRALGEALLDRAVARGEIPATIDRDLALDLIPSPLYWRMVVRGKPAGRDDIKRQVTALVAALKAC
ncbi:TetR/AcrR family transcriptional regulator C-terminal ligand-binding domain-containing protein [Acuticoccus sp. M5D2P5]|uniref:TetR-like C-terminal domain-containing protein n=1 Tax=Acuticoccus kalidii TaxID=2910977 RepID=UPI001F173F5D|nr:TetR-like C-terminal domain-containing protein [Acuticoccus kalidii]MCF3934064.1 TetR/AcrR family transcriptional regulator C-terminal ligand-binding domain-containing protein [Acuticoccus kalidii]